jgi:hypothetical protein
MSINHILRNAWKMLWNYRALWLFGAALAMVGVGAIYTVPWSGDENNNDHWTQIKLTEEFSIRVPGGNMTIDLTDPKRIRIVAPEGTSWNEVQRQIEEVERDTSIHFRLIFIELGIILVGSILLGLMARYIAETAMIHMVNETAQDGKRLSVWEGLRRGWSPGAGRLFLLDLASRILIGVIFAGVFGLAIAPLLLALGSRDWVVITLGIGTVGLLSLTVALWFATIMLLSLVLQPIRRVCVLEKQSLMASIRQGIRMMKHNLKELGLIGLIWLGIRLVWVPLAGMILLLLVPILLMTTLLGVAVGGVPAILVTSITSLFTDGLTTWIMGVLAGFPIFILIMISPMLFISGLMEVYLSSIWTLAYRDLRAVKHMVKEPASQTEVIPAPATAD